MILCESVYGCERYRFGFGYTECKKKVEKGKNSNVYANYNKVHKTYFTAMHLERT